MFLLEYRTIQPVIIIQSFICKPVLSKFNLTRHGCPVSGIHVPFGFPIAAPIYVVFFLVVLDDLCVVIFLGLQ